VLCIGPDWRIAGREADRRDSGILQPTERSNAQSFGETIKGFIIDVLMVRWSTTIWLKRTMTGSSPASMDAGPTPFKR